MEEEAGEAGASKTGPEAEGKVQLFNISESQALASVKGSTGYLGKGISFVLRNHSLLHFGDSHYFRLKERRHHHRGLSKRQDVLWEAVRDGPSEGID